MSSYDQWAAHLDPDSVPDEFQTATGPGLEGANLPAGEAAALDRISASLADPSVWDGPSEDVKTRLLGQVQAEQSNRSNQTSVPPPLDNQARGPATAPGRPAPQRSASEPVVSLDQARERRGRRLARVAGAAVAGAAAAAAVLAFVVYPRLDDGRSDFTTYEVAGTELTPDLDATVEVEPLAAGVAITLNIMGLPPAGEGEYYAAWLMEEGAMGDGSMDDGSMDDSMDDSDEGSMDDDSMDDGSDEGSMDDGSMDDGSMSMMGEMVGVGSFHWREGGIPIELWSGVDTDRYPIFTVTLQQEGAPATASDVVVMTARLDG